MVLPHGLLSPIPFNPELEHPSAIALGPPGVYVTFHDEVLLLYHLVHILTLLSH